MSVVVEWVATEPAVRLGNASKWKRAWPRMLSVTNKNANFKVEVTHRVNKNANFKVEVTHAKQSQRRGASPDVRDRLVDLERLSDCDATLGTELVPIQAENEGVTKKE
jgi:hypothetical protein